MSKTNVLIAPYGVDVQGKAFPPHTTQELIRVWVQDKCLEDPMKRNDIPVLYIEHGVNAGGTRGILAPTIELMVQLPGMRVLCGRKDFADLRLSAMQTFLEGSGEQEPPVAPPALVVSRDLQEHRYDILAKGGKATIFFKNLKDIKGLGSQQFGIILVHEAHEITLPMYRTLKQRCRQRGYPCIILMEGNPPSDAHWLTEIRDRKSPNFDKGLTVLTLPSTENYAFMDPGYRSMLEAMPASWRRRYLLGLVGSIPEGTPVYPAYVEQVHMREPMIIPDRPIIRSMDFGYRRAACIWAQKADDGQLLVHREWMALETPEEQFISGVKERTNEWFGPKTCVDYGDPAARNRDPHGVSTLTRLDKAGIKLIFRQTTYAQRIPLINQRLSLMINGRAAIVISPLCSVLREALQGGYHYPSIDVDKKFGPKHEIPEHDQWFSHLANAFEYLMVNLYMGIGDHVIPERRARAVRRRKKLRHSTGLVGF